MPLLSEMPDTVVGSMAVDVRGPRVPIGAWTLPLVGIEVEGLQGELSSDAAGEPLGYARVRELFAAAAGNQPEGIIDELAAAVSRWTEGGPPNDDVTFVVLRVR